MCLRYHEEEQEFPNYVFSHILKEILLDNLKF